MSKLLLAAQIATISLCCTGCDQAILDAVNECMETFYDGSCGDKKTGWSPTSTTIILTANIATEARHETNLEGSFGLSASDGLFCRVGYLTPRNGKITVNASSCGGISLNVSLSVPQNCSVDEPMPKSVPIIAGEAAVEFRVRCE